MDRIGVLALAFAVFSGWLCVRYLREDAAPKSRGHAPDTEDAFVSTRATAPSSTFSSGSSEDDAPEQ